MMKARSQVISILSLPPELQTAILQHLLPFSVGSIQSVLRVCKQLYHIALPLSVHTFRSIQSVADEQGVGPVLRRQARILAFLKYVTITKPFLASRVKRIAVGSFRARFFEFEADIVSLRIEKWTLPAAERRLYQEMVLEVAVKGSRHDRSAWVTQVLKDVDAGYEEAAIVLLLASCRGVEDFCYGEPDTPELFQYFVQAAAEAARLAKKQGLAIDAVPLHNLRSLYHESLKCKSGYERFAGQGVLFFALPRLLSYECVVPNSDDVDAAYFLQLPLRSSPVEHIALRNGYVSGCVMRAMVGACAALRSFEYSCGISDTFEGEMNGAAIMDAMLLHSSTLQLLDLSFEPIWRIELENMPQITVLGARLKELRALKTLKVGSPLLTGIVDDDMPLVVEGAPRLIECLPESLERLEIYDCGRSVLGQLQELLDTISDAFNPFQSLKFVRFLFHRETTRAQEINLACSASPVLVEAVIQSKEQECHDRSGGRGTNVNLCTRIHSATSREVWLTNIGSGTRVEVSRTVG